MYSSTGPDTLHPVMSLGISEHVEPASRSKSREVDYEWEANDYVMMAHLDNCSGNRTPCQASPVPWIRLLQKREQPTFGLSAHKKLTPDLVNGRIHGFLLKRSTIKPDVSSQQNEKARCEQIASW